MSYRASPATEPDIDDEGGAGAARAVEVTIAGLLAVLGTLAVGYAAREWWFHSDAWDFLTGRTFADPVTLLHEHAGHWQMPTAVMYVVTKGAVGMDFWPAYFIPRLVGYTAWCLWLWVVLRRRGAHRITSLAILALSLILVVSDWHDLSTIGNLIALSVALGVATIAVWPPESETTTRWALFGLLTLAVASTSLGVAVLLGSVVSTAFSRTRLRTWWPSLLGAGAVYAVWYASFHETSPSDANLVSSVFAVPYWALRIVQHAMVELLRLDFLGTLAAGAVIVGLVWLAVRRRLDGFDAVLLSTLAVYLGMVIVYRVAPGSALSTATRYSHNVLFLLAPVIAPRIAPSKRLVASIGVAIVAVALLPPHWSMLGTRINFWEHRAQASRDIVESAAYLMNTGEPWLANSPIDPPRAGMLTTSRLAELTREGWQPPPSADQQDVEAARGHLRFSVRPSGNTSSTLPTVTEGTEVDSSCVLPSNGSIDFLIDRATTLVVRAPGDELTITWQDGFGRGTRILRPRSRIADRFFLSTLNPDEKARLGLRWETATEAEVCVD